MRGDDSLVKTVDIIFPFPLGVVRGYSKLDKNFTSGDLARQCDLPSSTAKYYVNKMVDLRMIRKNPDKRMYQKYGNASSFSSWFKDLIRLVVEPLEQGDLEIPEEYGEQ